MRTERVRLSVFPSPTMPGKGESSHLWLLVHFHLQLTVHINAQKNLTQWREGFREIQLLSPNLGEEFWKREIILTGCFSAFSYCNDNTLTKVTSRKKSYFALILGKPGQQELEAAGHTTPTSGSRE